MSEPKTNRNVVTCALLVFACVTMFFICRWCESHPRTSSQEEIIEISEEEVEVADVAPVVRDSVVIRYVDVEVPITPKPVPILGDSVVATPIGDEIKVVVSGDSAEVQIPIFQKIYETEDYKAYVSGYRAHLDSIFVTQRFTTIKVREPTKQKRFSVGVQAGYGFTPKGFQPYIGIGVSVNLFSF